MPNRFKPKFSLFELYIKMGQKSKVLEIAREISRMKMKVYSTEAGDMKSRAIDFIKKNTHESKEIFQ